MSVPAPELLCSAVNRFDDIRRIVMEDPVLMATLTAAPTEPALFSLVIGLARERGIEITPAELEEIARAGRRAFLERWLPQ